MEEVKDEAMLETYRYLADIIIAKMADTRQLLVGIAGPPGSGKSTTSQRIKSMLPQSAVVPMDGYHYNKSTLLEFPDPVEAFRRRGSPWTFNAEKFVNAIESLKRGMSGSFPSFDHKLGDPLENDIVVDESHRVVIIEGNYLLLNEHPWNKLKSIFDITIYIHADLDILRSRIVSRHVHVGCSEIEAVERFETNDLLNAIEIEKFKERADIIVASK